MDERHRRELAAIAGPDIRFDRPLRLYTTFRVGGNAAAFFRARRLEDLQRVLSYAASESLPVLVVGKGSNMIVSDRGFDGLALRLLGELARVEVRAGASLLEAGGGATIRRMTDACIRHGVEGLEFLAGIPGTAGGALAMNAGSHGRVTGEAVESVQWMTRLGNVEECPARNLTFGYRECRLPEGVVVTGVRFRVRRDTADAVFRRVDEHLAMRRRALPREALSAGSVFRNPEGDSAGRLLEAAGLKGRRVGGAMISREHANVIVNTGGATAEDILSLMWTAREEVRRSSGIQLEPEVRIIG